MNKIAVKNNFYNPKILLGIGLVVIIGLVIFFRGAFLQTFTGKAIIDDSDNYLILDFEYTEGGFELIDLEIKEGYFTKEGRTDFQYEVRLFEGEELLYVDSFNSDFIFSDVQDRDSLTGGVILNTGSFSIDLPFFERSDKVVIVNKENNQMFEFGLEEYLK